MIPLAVKASRENDLSIAPMDLTNWHNKSMLLQLAMTIWENGNFPFKIAMFTENARTTSVVYQTFPQNALIYFSIKNFQYFQFDAPNDDGNISCFLACVSTSLCLAWHNIIYNLNTSFCLLVFFSKSAD